jgi:hypothetical protein
LALRDTSAHWYQRRRSLQRLASILGVIICISVGGYIVLSKLQHGGIWGLLGFETMTSVHSFVVNSPDGRTRSQVREQMDGNDAVVVDIERLNDHKKTTQSFPGLEKKFMWVTRRWVHPIQ